MKKIIAIITIISVLIFGTIKVNAEDVEDTSASSTPTETPNENVTEETIPEYIVEDVVDDKKTASDLEIWFENNLGWLVGIPTGMLTTLISIALFVYKTKKKFDLVNEETTSQNKNTKENLVKTKELVDETKKQNEVIVEKIDNFVETNEKQMAALTKALETTTKELELSNARIAALEEVIEMIALHTKELVANGTAEEITKKIRG